MLPYKKRTPGFTLVELMIVVAIIGVLAALAIYGVARYLKHSKTAEATRSLGAIETGNKVRFGVESDTSGLGKGPWVRVFCGCAGAALGASSSCQALAAVPMAKKLRAPAGTYNVDPWTCLKFNLLDPQFYQYTYAASGIGGTALYTAVAIGDLDGNTKQSVFTLNGAGSSTGDATRVKMFIVDEDE